MKTLLRIVVVLAALHIGLALVAATAMSLRPQYPSVTRITAVLTVIAIAGSAAFALWALWRLRSIGAWLVGAGYALSFLSQMLHLARRSDEFSLISTTIFGAVVAIVVSPWARRLYHRDGRATPSQAAAS